MIQSTGATVRRKRARWRRAWPIRSSNKAHDQARADRIPALNRCRKSLGLFHFFELKDHSSRCSAAQRRRGRSWRVRSRRGGCRASACSCTWPRTIRKDKAGQSRWGATWRPSRYPQPSQVAFAPSVRLRCLRRPKGLLLFVGNHRRKSAIFDLACIGVSSGAMDRIFRMPSRRQGDACRKATVYHALTRLLLRR